MRKLPDSVVVREVGLRAGLPKTMSAAAFAA
jgi:hypothetical protein